MSLLLPLLLAVFALALLFSWHRRTSPPCLDAPSRAWLQQQLPLYRRLPIEVQEAVDRLTPRLLRRLCFEGCGGLALTQEMQLVIAAQAALLLAGRGERDYPALGSVLVYPGAFIADGGLFVEGGGEVRLGESWQHGTVVLSWDSVRRAAAGHSDGLNVVLHEFAHQLDPAGDNEPRSEVFEQEYGKLRVRARRGRRSLLDSYGADSRSEFFAVATEAFFERPRTMRERHPALYDEMAGFYRLDPAVWQEPPDRALSTGERV